VTRQPILDHDGYLIIHPATHLNGPWVNRMVMGVDQGPMLLALENHRSGLIWTLTNGNRNVRAGLDAVFGPLAIFRDGFESGSTSTWSARVP